jgi:O-antigen ligase
MRAAIRISGPELPAGRVAAELWPLLFASVALAFTCFTAPGRSGPYTLSSMDALAASKVLLRSLSFLTIVLLVLRLNFHPRMTAALGGLLPLGVFAGWALTTVLWSPLKVVSLGHAVELIMLTALATCVAVVVSTDADIRKFACGLFLAAAGACVLVMTLDARLVFFGERPNNYLHPNSLGAIGGLGIMILSCARILWNWNWARRMTIPGLAICGTALYVSRSRNALLTTFIVLSVFLWKYSRRTLALIVLLGCGGGLALAPYVPALAKLPAAAEEYVLRGQTREAVAHGSGRDEMWAVALASVADAPVFGHGYYSMSPTGMVVVWGKEQVQTAHNVFLHVLTGTGAIGLALFLWAMLWLAIPVVRQSAVDRTAVLATCALAFQAIAGCFEIGILGPVDPPTVIVFCLMGAGVGATLNGPRVRTGVVACAY